MRKLYSLILGLLVVLGVSIPPVLADQAQSQVVIGNVAPTVTAVEVDDTTAVPADEIDLTELVTTTVTCNGTVTDNNGYNDISSATAVFFDTVASTYGGADDNNDHYTNSSCELSAGSGLTKSVTCEFYIEYYANPQTWNCTIQATDGSAATGMGSDTTTVNVLTALDMPAVINYGTVNLGEHSANITQTITNSGNEQIDITLDGYGASNGDGYSMICSTGSSPNINLENEHYGITANLPFTAKTNLTDTPVTETAFNLAQRTNDVTPITKDTFWEFLVPTTDVGGTCTGYVNIAAVSG